MMEKNPKNTARGPAKSTPAALAGGTAVSLAAYVLLQLLLAFLTVRSVLPEKALLQAQAVSCGLAALLGGLFAARRTGMNVLSTTVATACCFVAVMLLVGFLVYDRVVWNGQSGHLLLAAACGGVLAGLPVSGKKRGSRARKRNRVMPGRKSR
jgi:putative membrane protein, TIGR04086 family/integral membrane protein, TIGR04097 family